ncbi:1130_t:CDS:2, partial [Dentiscutata heterogama]
LCKNPSDDAFSKLYKHDPEYLINKRYFRIEPAATAFTLDVEPISYPDKCELKQLHLLTRHGSRLPEAGEVLKYDQLQQVFANVSVAKEWYKNPFTLERNFQLVHRGEVEPYYDGKQCALRYDKFWNTVKEETGRFDPEVVHFQGCSFSRCGESAMAFSEGLFDGYGKVGPCKNQPVYITSTPVRQDYVLEPYQDCLLLNTTVFSNNPRYNEQIYAYGNTTLTSIAKLLTFNRTDTWCSLLSELDIKKLRYYWDMSDYYLYEYGSSLNEQTGCAYVTQLVNGVENYLNGSSVMKADLKNGHSHGMLMVLTTLGVHRNPTLTANFTLEQIEQIKYSEAKTIFWSSTIYFEIYTCSDKSNSTLIRLVLNFEPLLIPGCEGEYCEWSTFKK